MREAQNQTQPAGVNSIPPFWIRPTDDAGQAVDERVLQASRQLWRWAYYHVQTELHDAPHAAELLEDVALEVSARLHVEPSVARNLTGYLITAFHHRVLAELLNNSRLVYEGLVHELEQNHRLEGPDWIKKLEMKLCFKFFVSFLSHPVRHILHCRMLGFSWNQIGKRMGLSEKQVKSRFYYGVDKACEKLTSIRRNSPSKKEPEE